MFYWSCEEKVSTTATAHAVWQLWANLESCPKWDSGITWAKLESSFAKGAYITMKPAAAPPMKSLLQEVTPQYSFTTCSKLPLTNVFFIHTFLQGTLCHKVEMRGALVPLFKRLFGYAIQRNLPTVVRRLATIAEEANQKGDQAL